MLTTYTCATSAHSKNAYQRKKHKQTDVNVSSNNLFFLLSFQFSLPFRYTFVRQNGFLSPKRTSPLHRFQKVNELINIPSLFYLSCQIGQDPEILDKYLKEISSEVSENKARYFSASVVKSVPFYLRSIQIKSFAGLRKGWVRLLNRYEKESEGRIYTKDTSKSSLTLLIPI